jgi:hypothetical protein
MHSIFASGQYSAFAASKLDGFRRRGSTRTTATSADQKP